MPSLKEIKITKNQSKSKKSKKKLTLKKINLTRKTKQVNFIRKTKKKQRHSTKGYKSISTVNITDLEEGRRYRIKSPTRVTPKVWELANRKTFFNWVDKTFRKYKSVPKESKQISQRLTTKTKTSRITKCHKSINQ